jgi:hypothetical protein
MKNNESIVVFSKVDKASSQPAKKNLQQDVGTKIMLGGVANMFAATCTNPIDVVKIRLQLQGVTPLVFFSSSSINRSSSTNTVDRGNYYRGFRHGLATILKEEGIAGWYKGLEASLLREGSYSALRFGLYDTVKGKFDSALVKEGKVSTALYIKILAGATTGAIGSALANPMDLVKVRMQGDRTGKRYNNSFIYACKDIYRKDGFIKGFYRGVGPTTIRAMVLTATQLPSYDHMKHSLLEHSPLEEGLVVHVTASMFAGIMAATVSSPADVLKTKIMNQCRHTRPDQYHQSKIIRNVLISIFQKEGIKGFFKGWLPNWIRIGPHTILSLLAYEELRKSMGLQPV